MIISFTPIKLAEENPTAVTHAFIDLQEDYFTFSARYYADVPVLSGHPEPQDTNEIFHCFRQTHKRKDLAAVSVSYISNQNVWKLMFEVKGTAFTQGIYFKRESHCIEMETKLIDYMLNKIVLK